jgi:hypothetical protein
MSDKDGLLKLNEGKAHPCVSINQPRMKQQKLENLMKIRRKGTQAGPGIVSPSLRQGSGTLPQG